MNSLLRCLIGINAKKNKIKGITMYNYKIDKSNTEKVIETYNKIKNNNTKILINKLNYLKNKFSNYLKLNKFKLSNLILSENLNKVKISNIYAIVEDELKEYKNLDKKYTSILCELEFERDIYCKERVETLKELNIDKAISINESINKVNDAIGEIYKQIEEINNDIDNKLKKHEEDYKSLSKEIEKLDCSIINKEVFENYNFLVVENYIYDELKKILIDEIDNSKLDELIKSEDFLDLFEENSQELKKCLEKLCGNK